MEMTVSLTSDLLGGEAGLVFSGKRTIGFYEFGGKRRFECFYCCKTMIPLRLFIVLISISIFGNIEMERLV
jgi:hypothetical protein